MDWSHCRSFLAILRDGSLSGAARTLAVAQPTVRRHLEALEESLGISLFVRSPAGLVPTEAALDLRPAAEAMEAAAGLFQRAAADAGTMAGTVRITASEIVAVELLPPIVAEARALHPGLALEVVATNTTLDLLRYEADLAVRMTRPDQGDLVASRAVTLGLGLYAHERWLEGHQAPDDLTALVAGGGLIGYDRNMAIIQGFRDKGVSVPRSAFCYRSDSDLAQLAALRAGVGIGICQNVIAARDPALRRILPDLTFDLEVWLVVHPDRRSSLIVRTVFDLLAAGLRRLA